tara:strand:- start:2427 stop:2969 length:543 start_codon:yes stop_codon:yes gene_type:complete
MSKTRNVLESTYEGFKKIAEKKYNELKSKYKTGEIKDLSIPSVLDFSQASKNNSRNKARRYTRDGVKNFINNKKINGKSSGTNFTYKSLIYDSYNLEDLSKIKIINGGSSFKSALRSNIDSPTLVSLSSKYNSSNPNVGVKSSLVSSRNAPTSTSSSASTSTSASTTTSTSSGSSGSGGY